MPVATKRKTVMSSITTIRLHSTVKEVFRGIPEDQQGTYRGLWHELVFNSDDQEDYADLFLAEVNREAEQGALDEEHLRRLIAVWYDDLLDLRDVHAAREEGKGGHIRASDLFRELGV